MRSIIYVAVGTRLLTSTASAAPTLSGQSTRTSAIREAFQVAWQGYYAHAFPHDTLHPVDNTFDDDRNGWGATAIDALDTAIVMGNEEAIGDILRFVPTINWAVSARDSQVSLFETTIRYLGGLLSAYDLLNGPLRSLVSKDSSSVPVLLEQAVHLANNLSFAFDTPTGIPQNGLLMSNRTLQGDPTNSLSGAGTLVLEWTHLSDLTGNETYGQLAQKGERYLLKPRPSSAEPWPGLVADNVNVTNGEYLGNTGSWDGGSDSFYEYLIKACLQNHTDHGQPLKCANSQMYVYDSQRFGEYKDRWVAAADSTINNIGSHPKPRPDLTFLADWEGKTLSDMTGNLACFAGGNFILGGLALNERKYTEFGLQLVDGCYHTFQTTITGIGVGSWSWNDTTVPDDQRDFYDQQGYYQTNQGYPLRPEVIESIYYAWRATGDTKYRDWSWDAFVAINTTCRAGSGFSGLNNVQVAGGGGFDNVQQTWFLAEVLKYLYLTQADDDVYQVSNDGDQKWVFSTEAHPFKVAR